MGLRDAHFFRKVPNDVTEATKVGGLISVLAVVTIFWLCLLYTSPSPRDS